MATPVTAETQETTTAPERLDAVELENLMIRYLGVCNEAIARNRDRFWYRQAKQLNQTMWGDNSFRTLVYDDAPDEVLAEFEIYFDPEVGPLSLVPPGSYEPAFTWKVPLRYLRDVVEERPDWYLEHPAMLDAVWMADRVRDEVTNRRVRRVAVVGAVGVAGVAGLVAGGRRLARRRRS